MLWQPATDGPVVALVHRPRYDDWSLPKGKTQAGEHVLLTAVREVAEETGIRVVLGRRLPSTHYQTHGGRPKVVDYWAAQAADGPQPGFIPNDEVDQVDWLACPGGPGAAQLPARRRVLDEFAAGPPDTVPVILLRHASAVHKMDWQVAGHDDDLKRPLDPAGGPQAAGPGPAAVLLRAGLGGQLGGRAVPGHRPAVREPWRRAGAGRPGAHRGAVRRGGHPRRRVDGIVGSQRPAVVCGHRENLPLILEEACAVLGAKLPEDRALPLAGFWVLHAAGTRWPRPSGTTWNPADQARCGQRAWVRSRPGSSPGWRAARPRRSAASA